MGMSFNSSQIIFSENVEKRTKVFTGMFTNSIKEPSVTKLLLSF